MKHTVRKNHRELYVYRPKYPNAASREYYRQKVLDAVTAVVSVIGFLILLVCASCYMISTLKKGED